MADAPETKASMTSASAHAEGRAVPADDAAIRSALERLLAELPAEFSEPPGARTREEFRVVKASNVRRVHEALWDLQRLTVEEPVPDRHS